jgi:hypothetical protein
MDIGVVLEVPILRFCVHTNKKIFEGRCSSFSYIHSAFVHIPVPSMLTQGIRDSYEVEETTLLGLHY